MKVEYDMRSVFATLDMAEEDVIEAVGKAVTENINELDVTIQSTAPRAGDATPKIGGGAKIVDYNIASYTYKVFTNNGANAEFGIGGEAADLAAFIEFGTGTDAAGYVPTLDSEWQKQAMEHYKNGKGSLAHVPFLLPAWARTKDKILKDAQENINKITTK